MPKATVMSGAALQEELQRVAEALAGNDVKGPERLALLRRQATLGDLRDALAQRERSGGS
jgi:hypothetical protein